MVISAGSLGAALFDKHGLKIQQLASAFSRSSSGLIVSVIQVCFLASLNRGYGLRV